MNKKKIYIILWAVFVCVALFLVVGNSQKKTSGILTFDSEISLSGRWNERKDSESGATIYQYQIPENSPENLVFSVKNSMIPVSIYLEGEKIYSWGDIDSEGSIRENWITLPGDSSGEMLELRTTGEDKTLLAILNGSSYLGKRSDLLAMFIGKNLYALIFGIFSVILSCILWVFTLCMRERMPAFIGKVGDLAALILCAGIWIMTDSSLLQLVTTRLAMVSMISFLSFYIMPIFLLRFLEDLIPESNKKFRILQMLYLINAIVCISLHLSGIRSTYRTIFTQHVLVITTVVIILKEVIVAQRKTRQMKLKKLLMGFVLLSVCGVAALISYYVSFSKGLYPYFYTLGMILLLLCLFEIGIRRVLYLLELSVKSDAYKQLAFEDSLTGLGNRAAYMSEIEVGDIIKNPVYIMMDINNLKVTNDQIGHQAGDDLIETASICIKDVFQHKGYSYRIGGDEFLVVLDGISEKNVKKMLEQLKTRIDEVNEKRDVKLQIACGYSMARTADFSKEKIFREADENMYRNKREMKEKKKSYSPFTS